MEKDRWVSFTVILSCLRPAEVEWVPMMLIPVKWEPWYLAALSLVLVFKIVNLEPSRVVDRQTVVAVIANFQALPGFARNPTLINFPRSDDGQARNRSRQATRAS